MKRFLKQVLVVVFGIFTSLVLLVGILLLLLPPLLKPSKPKLKPKTVLRIALHGSVVERDTDTFAQLIQGNQEEILDLIALKEAIKQAQADKHIRGIYLEVGALRAGWASLEEIRASLLSFKKAGKFIVAYGENYTQKTYYLASLADDIVLHPAGIFPWQGLHQTVFFFKALLDKLEIAPQVFRVGQYKSAVEPFTRQDMSSASKHQSTMLLTTIYDHFLYQVAKARTLKKASLQTMADTLAVVLPQDAYQAKLISQIGYADEAEALIKAKLAIAPEATIRYIAYDKYALLKQSPATSKNQVAVLVAEGAIVDGKGTPGMINSKDLAGHLKTLREDKAVKAVVLRINSPGGSALASDVLWQELMLTKARKPVVASLSDVAASGGYYLASACDRIVAHPTTITGSIGIFGLFFDVNALLSNKLGITTDSVKLGRSADFLSNPGRPLTSHEQAVIQRVVDKGYDTFIQRVATGRGLDQEAVAQVASGRVWSGQAAQTRGLVDDLGGLDDAIQAAAQLAAIDKNYSVSYWPKPKTLSEQILSSWRRTTSAKAVLHAWQADFPALGPIRELVNMTGVQARLPYRIEIE
ncbi:MAG: signal peptide peptidase SppA [Bacteroidota bacterium]